jgi:thiol-disulfide isomerase/thioredoxin
MRFLSLTLLLASSLPAQTEFVDVVKAAATGGNFVQAEGMLGQYLKVRGTTPEYIAAHSWLGRGALKAKQLDKADGYAQLTRELALAELKKRKLDQEILLPLGLGASIEVQGLVLALRGDRAQAVGFLNHELATYKDTSIHARIQKNINLISLVGKPAPPLMLAPVVGPKCKPGQRAAGKPTLVFFWAHWCSDCKAQGPVLERIRHDFPELRLIAPTMLYGYTAGGQDAPPAIELKYIDEIRQQYYGKLVDCSAPVSTANFDNYGSSSTPTLVLLDRQNVVRVYHPGAMSYEELAGEVKKLR